MAELVARVGLAEKVGERYTSSRGGTALRMPTTPEEDGEIRPFAVSTMIHPDGVTFLVMVDERTPYILRVGDDTKSGHLDAGPLEPGAHELAFDGAFVSASLSLAGEVVSSVWLRQSGVG